LTDRKTWIHQKCLQPLTIVKSNNMNRWIICLCTLLALTAVARAQHPESKSDVPEAVKNAFKTQFTSAPEPTWQTLENGNYTALFYQSGEARWVRFSRGGAWLETKRRIENDQLPVAIQSALKEENFSISGIDRIDQVETADHGTYYAVTFKTNAETRRVEFTPEGKRLKSPRKVEEVGQHNE